MKFEILDGANSHIFDLRIKDSDSGECVAFCNEEYAPLLSSAPDLLEALQCMMDRYDDESNCLSAEHKLAAKAIAKAKGETL